MKKIASVMLLIIFSAFCLGSAVQIHPPWGQDGNALFIAAFGRDRYLIVKTRTSAAINAAIDALGAEGGEVYLPEGTYTIDATIYIDYANTTLTGSGPGTIFSLNFTDYHAIYCSNKSNFKISNILFDGNEGSLIVDPLYSMIYLHYDSIKSSAIIENCTFEEIDTTAIFARPQYDESVITILNCHFNNILNADSVCISTASADTGGGVKVANCSFTHIDKGIYGAGLATISGCSFDENDDYSIDVIGDVTISGNIFRYNNSYAINCAVNSFANIAGNMFYYGNSQDIYSLAKCNITGNTFNSNRDADGEIILKDIGVGSIVSGNSFTIKGTDPRCNYNVTLDNADYIIITDNVFSCWQKDINANATSTNTIISGNKHDKGISHADSILGDYVFYSNIQPSGISSDTKTDNYVILTSDFGKILAMNSANDKTFSLPSVGTADDKAVIGFKKIGAGKLTIDAADTDYVHDSTAGSGIYNQVGQTYAFIWLQYSDTDTRWYIINASGTWVTY